MISQLNWSGAGLVTNDNLFITIVDAIERAEELAAVD